MPNQVQYGFHRLADLRDRRITEVGVNLIEDAVRQSIEEHNRNLNQMVQAFVRNTQEYKQVYSTPQNARLQLLDEDGRAQKIKAAARYEVGFPLRHYGIAWGANWVTRIKMTVGQANDAVALLTDADKRTVRDDILISLFGNTNYTFDDKERGDLAVKALANGDGTNYSVLTGADVGSDDTHYKGQTGASITLATYQDIYSELTEHPENGDEVTVFVPTNQRAATEQLAGFLAISDPNVQLGSGASQLVGTDNLSGPGELFGYVGKCFVREWRQLPSDYVVAISNSGEKPLAMREDPEGELRGFRPAAERSDYPYWENQYIHRLGFGAWNRVGAVVYRINNAAYAVPTGFANTDRG
jgi:hypothetical protein